MAYSRIAKNGILTIDGRDYKSQTGGLVKVNLPYGVYDF